MIDTKAVFKFPTKPWLLNVSIEFCFYVNKIF